MDLSRKNSLVDPKDRDFNVFLSVIGIIPTNIFLTWSNCASHCLLNHIVYVSPIDFIAQAPFMKDN